MTDHEMKFKNECPFVPDTNERKNKELIMEVLQEC